MKCPQCNEDGNNEYYTPSGYGFTPPFLVTVTQICKNNHKFGKVVETDVDGWHRALETKLRKDYKIQHKKYEPHRI